MVRVFLVSAGGAVSQGEERARLAAVDRLGEELARRGIATPAEAGDGADFTVEVCGVYGAEEGPILRSAKHAARLPNRYRIVILRVRTADRRDDFACRDSAAGVPAEQEAAERIGRWWAESRRSPFLLRADEHLEMVAVS